MTIQDRIMRVQELLGLTHENARSPEDKELLLTAIEALWFIWRNGQLYEFEEYYEDEGANAPARIIAAFDTLEEAQAWLKARPIPPDMAQVLIANEYTSSSPRPIARSDTSRRIPRSPTTSRR